MSGDTPHVERIKRLFQIGVRLHDLAREREALIAESDRITALEELTEALRRQSELSMQSGRFARLYLADTVSRQIVARDCTARSTPPTRWQRLRRWLRQHRR